MTSFAELARRCAPAMAVAVALSACGGGGGSPGLPVAVPLAPSGSGSGSAADTGTPPTPTPTPASAPTITASLVDASDVPVASNSIGASTYVKAVLTDATGAAVPNKLTTFSTDPTVATLLQATVLSDAKGVARVKINPASLTAGSAGTVTVAATIGGTTPTTTTVDYQTSAANVTLGQFSVSPVAITALQTAAVSVKASVNGAAATSGQVSVSFGASCGSFSPAAAATGSDGTVSAVYQSLGTCSGPVTLTAQAAGSAAVSTTVNVAAAQAANLLFDSSDQKTIFTSKAASGIKQATVKFKVVNSSGEAMASQAVLLSLSSTAVNAGVTFARGATGTQLVSTDANGLAAVTVVAGALPTPVVVTAALASNPALVASSLTLAVTSGVPTQNAASLGAEKASLEAWNMNGVQTPVTFRIADRQGNPVPDGTAVTFVASSGLVDGSCNLVGSACTVMYTSQGTRPVNGRAIVLAYLDGEESFTDLNGNNSYDAGEPFFDMGTVFRDDNENGVYQPTEQTYPGGMTGSTACVNTVLQAPYVANTCDGVWSGSIRVRRQTTIAWATSQAAIMKISRTTSALKVLVADLNGNAMPTGSTVAAAVTTTGSACSIVSTSPGTVANSTAAGQHTITLNEDASCSNATIAVTVTTPGGVTSTASF